jgi:cell division protein FtsQ
MGNNKKYTFKKVLVVSVWLLLISGTVVLLIAAMSKKNNDQIAGVEIKISGVQNNYFISKKDVMEMLEKVNKGKLDKSTVNSLDLAAMENRLEKDQWVKKAEIFYDNNNVLQVKITEREPIARIFTISGASFYIDSSLTRLPLSDKFSARLPVFTGFPTEVRVLKRQDSVLLNEVKILTEYIGSHPFWMAQIDQIDITAALQFEMIPKLGNQLIRFGDANNYQEKFNKLLAFYKQVQTRIGWNKYSVLDIRFRNQVVGVNRNAAEIKSDSLRSIQIMKSLIEEAKKNSNDSTKIQLPAASDDNERVNNSPVLDNEADGTINDQSSGVNNSEKKINTVIPVHVDEKPSLKKSNTSENKAVTKRSASSEKPPPKEEKKTVKKPVVKKAVETPKEETNKVPKALMPAKSDY